MSYRSEVAILFNKKAVEKMPQDLKSVLEDTLIFSKKLDDGSLLFHDSYLKWYGEYEDVSKITKFMESLSEDGDGGCEFMRIGEEDDDIFHRSYGDWRSRRLWLSRSITLEGDEIMETIGGEEIMETIGGTNG